MAPAKEKLGWGCAISADHISLAGDVVGKIFSLFLALENETLHVFLVCFGQPVAFWVVWAGELVYNTVSFAEKVEFGTELRAVI